MNSVEDFDEAIAAIDKLSADGWMLHSQGLAEFDELRSKGQRNITNEALQKIYQKYKTRHDTWYQTVCETIDRLTDRNYYWVLFVNAPPNDGKWISGLGPDISSFLICFENRIRVLNDVLTMLDERRGTIIRQEIARKEHDGSYRYWLNYDAIAGKLYLNDSILLATTRLDWPPDRLLQQVFARPNKLITLDGVTSTQLSSALRDLGITGTLKKVFFPRTSGTKVMFRPYITNAEFVDEKHKDIRLEKK